MGGPSALAAGGAELKALLHGEFAGRRRAMAGVSHCGFAVRAQRDERFGIGRLRSFVAARLTGTVVSERQSAICTLQIVRAARGSWVAIYPGTCMGIYGQHAQPIQEF